jgi:protein subunit release factor A
LAEVVVDDREIREADLRMDCFTTGLTRGPIRIVHLPTGIQAEASTREEALTLLKQRLAGRKIG